MGKLLCDKACEMLRKGANLQALLRHMKRCRQCRKIIPLVIKTLRESLGLED